MIFQIIVHYPYNFPEGNALTMLQSIRGIIFISVKPTAYYMDERAESLKISSRKCVYPNEQHLTYFKYTYYNCITECRANITRELCGCIPFYYHFGEYGNGKYL